MCAPSVTSRSSSLSYAEIYKCHRCNGLYAKYACVLKKVHIKESSSNVNIVTVNSGIFARVLFSQNFAYAKFCENITLAKWQYYSVVY